jgi:hypothetical protein
MQETTIKYVTTFNSTACNRLRSVRHILHVVCFRQGVLQRYTVSNNVSTVMHVPCGYACIIHVRPKYVCFVYRIRIMVSREIFDLCEYTPTRFFRKGDPRGRPVGFVLFICSLLLVT